MADNIDEELVDEFMKAVINDTDEECKSSNDDSMEDLQTPYLTTFPLFPALPTEIRWTIWQMTLSPRIIELYRDVDGFFAEAEDPIALHVCRDSRKAVIGFYPFCFGSVFHPPVTRINFELDMLFFEEEFGKHVIHFFDMLKDHEIVGLKYLAIDAKLLEQRNHTLRRPGQIVQAVKLFSNLQELSIIWDVAVLLNARKYSSYNVEGIAKPKLPITFSETYRSDPVGLFIRHGSLPWLAKDYAKSQEDSVAWNVRSLVHKYGWRRHDMLKGGFRMPRKRRRNLAAT